MSLLPFLGELERAAERAGAAEAGFRREASQRIAQLERERAFAFRRLNLMRALADAVATAASEGAAAARAADVLAARLGWSAQAEAHKAVLGRFSRVAAALHRSLADAASDRPAGAEPAAALDEFEVWYAEHHGRPFWELFEHEMPETPRVDF